MTNAWFLGAAGSVPQTESEVRSTLDPIRNDNSTAEATRAPEWNEFESDESGELLGLSPRTVGSDTNDSEQSAPFWTAQATADYNGPIDDQVATSGTAASRESRGEFGHGTMQYAEGIEPVIRDGGAYGNDYFTTIGADIQDGAGNYMTPNGGDAWGQADQQAQGNAAARAAYQSTLYANFLSGS